ncbi:MAG TPA: ATP-binding protein [Microscillaceae bacterium]|nr:ATP-binding protein [Microscillaceae bacterium]
MADFQEASDNQKKKNANSQKSKKKQAQVNENSLAKDLSDAPQKQRQALIKRYFGSMVMDTVNVSDPHLKAIYLELNWWLQIVWCRYKNQEGKNDFRDFMTLRDFKSNPIQIPELPQESNYYQWLESNHLIEKESERLLFATVMALSLNDALFLSFLEMLKHPLVNIFVGGQVQSNGRRFIPTMQTLFYILGGVDLKKHTIYQRYFRSQQTQITNWGIEMVSLQSRITGYNEASDEWKNLLISLKPSIWQYFLGGAMPLPEDNQDLPLEKLDTSLAYEDLVLKSQTRHELKELIAIAKVGQDYFADKASSSGFRKGFIALLHGEPGTGKTLIATTIGKHTGLVTYQLKMSEVVSKYIGETSQNINKVFDELQRAIEWLKGKPSILFIDEADAILGKRSEVNDSKDRYANLDVSNLLQRVEKFPGLIILATNFQQNIDPAFHRRINVQIHVPPPDADERTKLWKNYCPAKYEFPADNFPRVMAEKFALTGAQINNIMKRATVMAHADSQTVLDFEAYIEQPLKSELIKIGKVYTRPQDLMSLAQIDEQIFQQELLWERSLPSRWRYIPTYLPRILSQSVTLSESDIKDLIKKVKRRWEGGAYNHIPFKEGIEVVLRDLCAGRNLDWNKIQAKIYELLEAEQAKNKANTIEADDSVNIDELTPEERSGKTIQLVDLSKLQAASKQKEGEQTDVKTKSTKSKTGKATKKKKEVKKEMTQKEILAALKEPPTSLGKVMGKKEAEAYWNQLLPEGYKYASKSTAKGLAEFYGVSAEIAQWVVKMSIEKADEQGETELTAGSFLNPAITEMEKTLGIESLMRQEHIERERKKKEAWERKKKIIPSWKSAPKYWAEAPPQGYRYARADTAGYMARFLPGWSFEQMLSIMEKAAEYALKDGTKMIAYTPHILPAFQELGIQPPM